MGQILEEMTPAYLLIRRVISNFARRIFVLVSAKQNYKKIVWLQRSMTAQLSFKVRQHRRLKIGLGRKLRKCLVWMWLRKCLKGVQSSIFGKPIVNPY